MVRSIQPLPRCDQPPRPSSRWWDASVEATVLQLGVLAGTKTYRAQTKCQNDEDSRTDMLLASDSDDDE